MSITEYFIWGLFLHMVADWFFQNEWQAVNKAKRRERYGVFKKFKVPGPWWDRHPAAYVHAGIHTVIQLVLFPWWAALIIGVLHLIIDTRSPLDWWGKFTRQTRASGLKVYAANELNDPARLKPGFVDVGLMVGFWRDQVAHAIVLAGVALWIG